MIDPITLTVLQNRFQQIADEMDVILDKAAFSPVISEGRDRSCGIYSGAEGYLIAQGGSATPVHVGTMHYTAGTIAKLPRKHRPGDIYIVNDPYVGGTHLQDVRLIMPVFVGEKLFCFLGSCGHWPDIGGSAAGGFATKATEIEAEGLRIPPMRLYREGVLDDDTLALILNNVRVPTQRLGDLQAQVAAVRAGEREIQKVVAEFGVEALDQAVVELRSKSAALLRDAMREIPPGTYSFEDALDNDGVNDTQLWIRLKMTVEPGRMILDFSESSKACAGPVNSPYANTCTAAYVALKHCFPDVPLNAGFFEPIEVIAPSDTFLHATYPRPVSGCASEAAQRTADVVFGALSKALPHRMHAAPFGTAVNLTIGGYDPDLGRRYVFYFYNGGGHGASADGDGLHNASTATGMSKTPPIEICEQQTPVRFDQYALRVDSGGAGQFQGGLGVSYTLRIVRGEGRLQLMGDRGKRGPFGVQGGAEAAKTNIVIMQGGKRYDPPMIAKDENVPLSAGDTVTVEPPGGGGYGAPSSRDRKAIETDLLRGYITQDFAARHYGKP